MCIILVETIVTKAGQTGQEIINQNSWYLFRTMTKHLVVPIKDQEKHVGKIRKIQN